MVNFRNIDNIIATFNISNTIATIEADGAKIVLSDNEARYIKTLINQRKFITDRLNDNSEHISSFIDTITKGVG